MHSTNLFTIEAAIRPAATLVEQWEMLAKCVPAVSSAAGKGSALKSSQQNIDLNISSLRSVWGRNDEWYGKSWLHSDIKDMAYRYVDLLFDDFVNRGGIR